MRSGGEERGRGVTGGVAGHVGGEGEVRGARWRLCLLGLDNVVVGLGVTQYAPVITRGLTQGVRADIVTRALETGDL